MAGAVLASIDADRDGRLSDAEQHSYAQRVLSELSIALDDNPLQLRLVASTFPEIAQMTDGLGDITLDLHAIVPDSGLRASRTLRFENRHDRGRSAYLVNCLTPSDPDIRVTNQSRIADQSSYRLDYTQGAARAAALPVASWSTVPFWLVVNGLVLGAVVVSAVWRWRRRAAGGCAAVGP